MFYLHSADPIREASIFDPFSLCLSALTMVNPTSPPNLVLLATTYRYCLSRAKTYTFCRRYTIVLAPYSINPTTSVAAAAPANVARLIYAAEQEGVPAAFLQ